MSVTAADLYSDLGLSSASAVTQRDTELGQDDFLRLMTEQLRNQDPLKPLESTQFLAQLAQFSTVKGISEVSSAVQGLAGTLGAGQSLQAASLVGRDVLVATDHAVLGDDYEVKGSLEADGPGTLTLTIKDSTGRTVRTLQVEAEAAGPVEWKWNGRDDAGEIVATGEYNLSALGADGASELEVSVVDHIDSVSLSMSGPVLNLAQLGAAPLGAVRQIR